jgi:hypothetical protein
VFFLQKGDGGKNKKVGSMCLDIRLVRHALMGAVELYCDVNAQDM